MNALRLLGWLAAMALVGCSQLAPAPTDRSNTDAAFDQIAGEYIDGYLAWRPQLGTALGWHQYDGRVTDFRQASLDAELTRLKTYDARLGALRLQRLTARASRDCRLLRAAIQREIFGFEQMQSFSQNPMTYAGALDVNIYIKRNFAPLPDRVRSLTAILKQAPQIMAAARANLAESLPRPFIETAIEEADGAAEFLGKDLVRALADLREERLMAEFQSANQAAIRELRDYIAYLKERKLPKAHDRFALGREKFIALVALGEMIELPPEQLLQVGLNELRHQQQAFAEAARQIDPGKAAPEVFRALQRDHPTGERLIPEVARDLEKIRQFVVDHRLITLPSPVRARVAETPQYLRATTFASMDTPGPFETRATEAYYYVTPPEPDWPRQQQDEWLTSFNYYTSDIVSVHEAYPGHYIQYLCLNASPANRLEKMFVSYAFSEGWAHYAEQMMVDEGFCGDRGEPATPPSARAARYRLAQADEALLRVCRLCVSIQMHCQGMTVDQATRFFQDNCYYEPKAARQEALRGTYDPEYLYYTYGKLALLKLRDDCRRQEGARFSLRQFHDELLRHGAPPVRLLREILLRDPAQWPQVL